MICSKYKKAPPKGEALSIIKLKAINNDNAQACMVLP